MAAPSVSSVSPASGPVTGATIVIITGTNLLGATAVTFAGTPATFFNVNSATQISAITPAHTAGTTPVTVTTPAGTSNAVLFFYLLPPVLGSLVPPSGPTAGGNPVAITGANLTLASAVLFGAGTALFSVLDDSHITTTAPPGTGAVTLTVVSPGGISNSIFYEYLPAPVLTGLNPNLGPQTGGNQVTITGLNLGLVTEVSFGNARAPFNALSDNQIVTTAPAGAGTVALTITTPAGTSSGTSYTYLTPPT